MLNNIPVFIDSRLDVYCSEFNDTHIFYDFIQVSNGYMHYEEIFSKYNFTHILGAQKASYVAEKTLRKVYKKVGFVAK